MLYLPEREGAYTHLSGGAYLLLLLCSSAAALEPIVGILHVRLSVCVLYSYFTLYVTAGSYSDR